LGYVIDVDSITDKVNDLGYGTAVGLVLWGKQALDEHTRKGLGGLISKFKSVDKASQHISHWFKSLLP
jgi:hypothetical protein